MMQVRPLASLSGWRILHCHELWCMLQTCLGSCRLWLWHRLAAVALIQPLARELPYNAVVALKDEYIYIFIIYMYMNIYNGHRSSAKKKKQEKNISCKRRWRYWRKCQCIMYRCVLFPYIRYLLIEDGKGNRNVSVCFVYIFYDNLWHTVLRE